MVEKQRMSMRSHQADGVRLIGQNGHVFVQGAKGREVRVGDHPARRVVAQ